MRESRTYGSVRGALSNERPYRNAMQRRSFLTLLGGSAAAWPLAARAQQTDRMRRVGVLSALAEDDRQSRSEIAALREGLAKLGWITGRNLQSDDRFAAGDERLIYAFAGELVGRAPDVILARGTQATAILKQLTSTIPVIFVPVSDPVASGFVASFARPAGNMTGFTDQEYSFGGKWLSILKSIVPDVSRVILLFDRGNANWDGYLGTLQDAGRSTSVSVNPAPVNAAGDIELQIDSFAREPGAGMIVVPSGLTIGNREMIIALAARHRLPAIYPFKFFAADGGVAAYGPDLSDLWRRAAEYVDRILKGAKSSELPVQAPTRFEFVINLQTARTLGIDVPATLLSLADEVIE
jgi:putative ABC transport system substrate-binding protein